jgi:4-hydroxybenzoate decarboxylase subunit C
LSFFSLDDAINALRREDELVEVEALVDPELELAEIHRRVVKEKGPALLFKKVKNSCFPVVTNLFGSEKRLEILFKDAFDRIERISSFLEKPSLKGAWQGFSPLLFTQKNSSFFTECTLNQLPFIKCWPDDGGFFLTLPLIYTQSLKSGKENLGMYRVQRHSTNECGLHFQIGKGGGFHFFEAEEMHQDLPVAIFLGGPPALILSAIMPLPENVSELLFASLIHGKRFEKNLIKHSPLPLLSCCDVALLGSATYGARRVEGPFGDHLGYLDPAKPNPIFQCEKILAKKNAVIPATVVGKPLQEDAYIGSLIQKLIRPFLSLVMPNLAEVYAYPEAGFHSVAAIRIKERYEKEALQLALRVLGEGQLSLSKILFVTDAALPLDNFASLLAALLSRMRAEEDIIVLPSTSNDTLDMTGPKQNSGSKALFFGIGPERRALPSHFSSPLPPYLKSAEVFCPGCLVLSPSRDSSPHSIVEHSSFNDWPLLILVDDAQSVASSQLEFLWTVFTRFEPGADMYAKETKIRRNGVSFSFPILFDARMKPSYSTMLQPSRQTVELVDSRWHEYFPKAH